MTCCPVLEIVYCAHCTYIACFCQHSDLNVWFERKTWEPIWSSYPVVEGGTCACTQTKKQAKFNQHSIMTVKPVVCLLRWQLPNGQLRFHSSALNIEHFYISCASHQCCAMDSLGFKMSSVTSGKLIRWWFSNCSLLSDKCLNVEKMFSSISSWCSAPCLL